MLSNAIEAVIFDMDGVISDTQKKHSEIESMLLYKLGIHLSSEEITRKYSGVQTSKFFTDLLNEHGIHDVDVNRLMRLKWVEMLNLTKAEIKEVPGAIKLVTDLSQRKIPLAVASASIPGFIDRVLFSLGIIGKFQETISSYDAEVKKGKPEPDIFLWAAKKLGKNPEKIVVIEDGINGMIGAKKAGMKCIGLVPNRRWSTPADVNVESLSEISHEMIMSM